MEQEFTSRAEEIHAKGFDFNNFQETDFKRIKVGVAQLDDAILNLGTLKESLPNHNYTNKKYIIRLAIVSFDDGLFLMFKFIS